MQDVLCTRAPKADGNGQEVERRAALPRLWLPFIYLSNSTHSCVQTPSHEPLCKWVGRMCSSTDVPGPSTR
jgi:hypothetical protein